MSDLMDRPRPDFFEGYSKEARKCLHDAARKALMKTDFLFAFSKCDDLHGSI